MTFAFTVLSARNAHTYIYGGGGGLVPKLRLTLVTPWIIVRQAPLSVGFPRQEYWNRFPIPSPRDLPDPGIEPVSPAIQTVSCIAGGFFIAEPQGKPIHMYIY